MSNENEECGDTVQLPNKDALDYHGTVDAPSDYKVRDRANARIREETDE